MTITLQCYEETGPAVSGRGTTLTEITNFNWKRSGDVTHAYYFYPLRRPFVPSHQTLSFKKYIFFKISGTYTNLKNMQLTCSIKEAAQADKTKLYYKWTNVYVAPDDEYDGNMIYLGDENGCALSWWPLISSSGPDTATSRSMCYGPNTTLYTGYFVTQMRVNKSDWNDIGNTAQLKFALTLHEFE